MLNGLAGRPGMTVRLSPPALPEGHGPAGSGDLQQARRQRRRPSLEEKLPERAPANQRFPDAAIAVQGKNQRRDRGRSLDYSGAGLRLTASALNAHRIPLPRRPRELPSPDEESPVPVSTRRLIELWRGASPSPIRTLAPVRRQAPIPGPHAQGRAPLNPFPSAVPGHPLSLGPSPTSLSPPRPAPCPGARRRPLEETRSMVMLPIGTPSPGRSSTRPRQMLRRGV